MKVKVNFFKPSGKWYCEEEFEWVKSPKPFAFGYDHLKHTVKDSYKGMHVVCLENPLGYPLMVLGEDREQ